MKNKKAFIITILFSLILPSVTASPKDYFSCSAGFLSGYPFYNRSETATQNIITSKNGFGRIVAGLTADFALKVSKPIQLVLGADSFCDFTWKDSEYFHSLDYGFFGGLKIFPDFSGLYFGLAYVLGSRTDFINQTMENEETISRTENCAWGNGFRLSVEYDFLYNKNTKVSPVLGFCYRYIPRGNYCTDHFISVYLSVKY